jgi:hypothetical protein
MEEFDKKEKQHRLNVSTTFAIFTKNLGDQVLIKIRDDLNAGLFRKAMKSIIMVYSSSHADRDQKLAIASLIKEIKWTKGGLETHMNVLDNLYEQSSLAGAPIHEDLKFGYLKNSIFAGPHKSEYELTILTHEVNRATYAVLVDSLKLKWRSSQTTNFGQPITPPARLFHAGDGPTDDGRGRIKKRKFEAKSGNKPGKNPGLVCGICGKGHAIEDCWSNKTCSHCGKPGHIAEVCYAKNGKGRKNNGKNAAGNANDGSANKR